MRLVAPVIDVFLALVQGDVQRFNNRLAFALVQHRVYWSSEVDNRARDPQGFVAWGPLALACLAFDLGIEIGVGSEYLPVELMAGVRRRNSPTFRDWQDWLFNDGRRVGLWWRENAPADGEGPQDWERVTTETARQLRDARDEVADADRALGEYSATRWLATRFPEDQFTLMPRHSDQTKWSRFDQVYEARAKAGDDVRYLILVPRGPDTPIIVRRSLDLRYYQQGHPEYLRILIAEMRASGGPAGQQLASELESAWAHGRLEYHQIHSCVDDDGGYDGYRHSQFELSR